MHRRRSALTGKPRIQAGLAPRGRSRGVQPHQHTECNQSRIFSQRAGHTAYARFERNYIDRRWLLVPRARTLTQLHGPGAVRRPHNKVSKRSQILPVGRLISAGEQSKLTPSGLCDKCNEVWHSACKCPSRKGLQTSLPARFQGSKAACDLQRGPLSLVHLMSRRPSAWPWNGCRESWLFPRKWCCRGWLAAGLVAGGAPRGWG